MKRVWLNINTGEFSNSWQKGEPTDILLNSWEDHLTEAAKTGWKLIEYKCVNDPDFELYKAMKLR
mgnify:CR=1 FL=1